LRFKGKISELTKAGLISCIRLVSAYREKRLRRQKNLMQAVLMSGSIKRIK
jgi:hypothetical protein